MSDDPTRAELERLRTATMPRRSLSSAEIIGVRRASQAGSARRPLTVREGCCPGLIAAVWQIAMAAHNAASALVAGEVLQRIRVYQDACKALHRLVTKDRMRTPQVRQSNANDRNRDTADQG